jgi:hypothetical protein
MRASSFWLKRFLEDLGQVRHLRIDVLRHAQAVDRIDRPEGQHDLEGVHRQVGRLEAEAESADVDDAVAHAAERLGDLDDRAAVALDPFDPVLGLGLDALLELDLEVVAHLARINHRRRVAGGDAKSDGLRRRFGRPRKGDAGCGERGDELHRFHGSSSWG